MQQKPVPSQMLQFSRPRSWVDKMQDDHLRLAIPIGPRFQADVPEWTAQHSKTNSRDGDADNLRQMGTTIWPLKDTNQAIEERTEEVKMEDVIGKGRPDFCSCEFPGSVECIKRHVANKRFKLQAELGPAFWLWKFNEMGEDVSKLWTIEEQKEFEYIVKTNPISEGKSFLKPALESLPSQTRQSIVNYYLNVYLPRRISSQTRSGCHEIDTDDESSWETPKSKGSRKRCQANTLTSHSHELVKTRYLTGKR